MKMSATVLLLVCIAVFSGCMAAQPMTDAERAAQARAEEERRWKAINTGY